MAALIVLAASALVAGEGPYGPTEGVASWYGAQFHGRLTASGEVYDKEKLTCAHRSLPFGTYLLVRNLDNGSSVVVRVSDRGPFAKGRILDLSEAAARIVGMIPTGTARVSFSVVPPEEALAWKGGALDGGAPGAAQGAPKAASAPPRAGTGAASPPTSYKIQVASFGVAANARATVERLEAAGLSPTIEAAGTYRRVVFLDLSDAEARTIAARLDTLGYRGYTVTASTPR
jgi:rare lipoprotein A